MTEPIIETEALRRVFRTRRGHTVAVDGIDLRVGAGEIFGFLGPNGAGKTTALRMLVTLLEPTGGKARVAGCDLRREPARVRERIGYVAQGGTTEPSLTAREELVLQSRMHGSSRAEARCRAEELLRALELHATADRRAGSYSGGQRRRLDLALGLVHRPRLVFLDEPTTGLDPQGRMRMWDEVRGLRDAGTTVFLTTHYLEEADALCDRLAIIDYGRIVAEGTPGELKRQIAGDVITLGLAGDAGTLRTLFSRQPFVREADLTEGVIRLYVDEGEAAMAAILRIVDGAGAELRTITLHRPSLDDVFLRRTGRSLRDGTA